MEYEKVGLTAYITKNDKVITALGVFIAIAGVTGDVVHEQKLSGYIQTIFIFLVALLLWELYKTFPKHRETLVELFASCLFFGAFFFILVIFANNIDLVLYSAIGFVVGLLLAFGFRIYAKLMTRKRG